MTKPVANSPKGKHKPLAGTVALVTGSARGLGTALALRLSEYGADIAIHYRSSRTAADEVASRIRSAGLRAETFQADMCHASQARKLVREVAETFGQLDHLVYNVGPFLTTPFTTLAEPQWDEIIDANLKSAWATAAEAAPCLRRSGHGHIIHIAANSAFIHTHSVYGLAKAGLIHLTESLAVELGPHISVNAIAPGLVEGTEPDAALRALVLERTPTRRLVTPSEIAEMCALICSSPAFASVTGRTIVMDGGRWLR